MNLEQDFRQLVTQLGQWTRRRRWRDALLWLPRGLLAGLLLAVLVAAVASFRPFLLNTEVGYVALGLAAAGLLGSLLYLLWQRYSLLQQARFADQQFRLQERATTAVELNAGQIQAPAVL